MKKLFLTSVFTSFIFLASWAAGAYELRYPPVRWMADLDRTLQTLPALRYAYDPLDGYLHGTKDEIRALTSAAAGLAGMSRKYLPGLKVEAIDTNNFEEVADSSWFTNRIGRTGVSTEDIAAYMAGGCPELKGPILVHEAAEGGDTPALLVDDSAGAGFILHPDPPDAQGIESARATAAALILHAAGYNAAPHCPVTVDRGSLTIASGARRLGRYGERSELTREALGKLLEHQPHSTRAVAARIPEGLPVGRFAFAGRLFIDKNDRLRHQDRRELRALRLFSAFIGWVKISGRSAFDVFAGGEDGEGYMQHWLLNLTDIEEPGSEPNLMNAGASLTNEAFAIMTSRDAYWATRLIADFTDPLIDAIISAAHYADESQASKDAQGLKSRRDAIAVKWFGELSPLDDFSLATEGGVITVSCTDLAVKAADAQSKRRYRARLTTPYGRAIIVPWREAETCSFTIDGDALQGLTDGRIYELDLQAKDATDEWWLPAVTLLVRAKGQALSLAGLEWRMR